MLKPYLLRFHRWLTLVFAAPLAVIVVTGLILSFEPIVAVQALKPGALTAQRIDQLLAEHDAPGKARSLSYRAYENVLSIGGAGPDGDGVDVDLSTGKETEEDGWLSELFGSSRGIHERLLGDLGWLVIASTFAMTAIVLIGVFMGLPYRLRNNLSGWHKATAWFLLPLIAISPITGLMLAYGVTFAGAPGGGGARGESVPIRAAVQMIAEKHDVSNMLNLRARGGRLMARIVEGGEYRAYAVTKAGVTPLPRNFPRLIHEGNWAGVWSGLVNVITSIAIVILMATGLIIWVKRKLRKPQRVRQTAPVAAQ